MLNVAWGSPARDPIDHLNPIVDRDDIAAAKAGAGAEAADDADIIHRGNASSPSSTPTSTSASAAAASAAASPSTATSAFDDSASASRVTASASASAAAYDYARAHAPTTVDLSPAAAAVYAPLTPPPEPPIGKAGAAVFMPSQLSGEHDLSGLSFASGNGSGGRRGSTFLRIKAKVKGMFKRKSWAPKSGAGGLKGQGGSGGAGGGGEAGGVLPRTLTEQELIRVTKSQSKRRFTDGANAADLAGANARRRRNFGGRLSRIPRVVVDFFQTKVVDPQVGRRGERERECVCVCVCVCVW